MGDKAFIPPQIDPHYPIFGLMQDSDIVSKEISCIKVYYLKYSSFSAVGYLNRGYLKSQTEVYCVAQIPKVFMAYTPNK